MSGSRLNRRTVGILLVVLLVRMMSPAGFMPGDLSAGDSLVVICPTGLPSDFLDSTQDHSHHGQDTDGIDILLSDPPEYCPFGLVLNAQHISPEAVIHAFVVGEEAVPDPPALASSNNLRATRPIRGPPVIS